MEAKRTTAKYAVIQNDIKQKIMDGSLRANDKIESEFDLMDMYGVSRITVVKALSELANLGWINRIAGKGSFVNENIDSLIGRAKEPTPDQPLRPAVGLIMTMVEDPYSTSIVRGVREYLEEAGYSVILKISTTRDNEIYCVEELLRLGVAGLIIFPIDYEIYNHQILNLVNTRFPFVLLDRTLPGIQTHYVVSNNRLGVQLALSYLQELGHKNICFCTTSPFSIQPIAERFNAFNEILSSVVNDMKPYLTQGIQQNYADFTVNKDLVHILHNRICTAFLTADATNAMYLYATATSMGLRVPEDISIVSYDDPLPAYGDLQFFTHVFQDGRELGKSAADILLQQMHEQIPEGTYVHQVLSPVLMVRRSTAPLRK